MLTYRWILSTKTLLLKGRGIKVTILVDLSHASFLICFSPSLANWEHDYYESWVFPAGVPSALADIGGGVAANN